MLASGGIDSAALAAELARSHESTKLCFVDYGQRPVSAERASVRLLADHLGLALGEVAIRGFAHTATGEIPYRNALLITTAAATHPDAAVVAIGIHGGTGYRDCSPAFVETMQALLDFHSDGSMQLAAPFAAWDKPDVHALALELGVPISMTHSCEASDEPCGACRSCLDRKALG